MAILCSRSGFPVTAVYNRTPAAAAACSRQTGAVLAADAASAARVGAVVIIATADAAILQVATDAAARGGFRPGQVVLHLSGALDSTALAPARESGAWVGSMHPLASIADVASGVEHLPAARWALEGSAPAVETAAMLLRSLGATYWELPPGSKPLYHAGAVLACNYLVTLVDLAARAWAAAGIPSNEAVPGLMPLLTSTLGNLQRLGLPQALTGPIRRGDVGTVQRHLAALDAAAPDIADMYRTLGVRTLPVAVATGLPAAAEAALRAVLLAKGDVK